MPEIEQQDVEEVTAFTYLSSDVDTEGSDRTSKSELEKPAQLLIWWAINENKQHYAKNLDTVYPENFAMT